MNIQSHKRRLSSFLLVSLAGILVVMLGLLFALAVEPAQALPPAQDGYPVETDTPTVTPTSGTAVGTLTVTPTPTGTRATLAPPVRTGTPTQLIPVTGADFTRPDRPVRLGIWIAIWLLGLLLVGFGIRSRLSGR